MKFPFIAAALLVAAPALAADLAPDMELGKTEDAVRSALTELGYDVRKIEEEDGEIEAYVVKDGEMAEVYVDPATGKVSKVKG